MKVTREEAFTVLGLSADADEAAIKTSFKRLALKHHPDKNGGCADSAEQFKKINAAYARLTSDHQSEDELDDADLQAFSEHLFAQMFSDGAFGMFMQDMLAGMHGGMHSRANGHRGPRVRMQRPAKTTSSRRGFPVRPSNGASTGFRPGRAFGMGGLGGMHPFMGGMGGMGGMFGVDVSFDAWGDDDGYGSSDSSGWETDDGQDEKQAEPSGNGSEGSSSEWETDNGTDNESDTDGKEEASTTATATAAKDGGTASKDGEASQGQQQQPQQKGLGNGKEQARGQTSHEHQRTAQKRNRARG